MAFFTPPFVGRGTRLPSAYFLIPPPKAGQTIPPSLAPRPKVRIFNSVSCPTSLHVCFQCGPAIPVSLSVKRLTESITFKLYITPHLLRMLTLHWESFDRKRRRSSPRLSPYISFFFGLLPGSTPRATPRGLPPQSNHQSLYFRSVCPPSTFSP